MRCVFVVADYPEPMQRVTRALEGCGVTTASFASVEQATAALAEARPLFVVLWPTAFTPALRQPWRMLQAYAREVDSALVAVGPRSLPTAEEALACGADEYLPDDVAIELLPARVEALRAPTLARRPLPSRPRTVLLADPDALWRMRVGGVLEAAGYHVLYAGHALEVEEALDGLRGPLPEICVVDAFSSELGGLDLLRGLRGNPHGQRLPVVLVSAVARDPVLLKALAELDIHDLLDKSHVGFDAVVPVVQDYVSLTVRRRAPRVSVLSLCRFRDPASGICEVGLIYNLSSTGAFVRSLAPLREGSQVQVEIELAPGAPLNVTALVAWAHPFQATVPGRPPPGMGLSFEALPEEVRQHLESRIWPTLVVPVEASGIDPPLA